MSGFWRAPRILRSLREDGKITANELWLVVWVGLHREGDRHGFTTTLAQLAAELDVSSKTISRALGRLATLKLLEHGLRQGQRQPFRIKLGTQARVDSGATSDTTSDATPDTARGVAVRSDFGQGLTREAREAVSESSLAPHSTSDLSRARRAETETEKYSRTTYVQPAAASASGEKTNSNRSRTTRFGELWSAVEGVGLRPPVNPSARSAHAELVWALHDEGATAADVRARAAAYRNHETLGGAMFTLPALTKHWHGLEGALPAEDATRLHLAALAKKGIV